MYGGIDVSLYQPYIGDDGAFSMIYVLLLAGEALIGVIMGFFISIIFAAFSSAGQFLAFQMGLSAASSYDALSQVENPLMGQFFNLVAMLVFMQTHWFQKLFLGGLVTSFSSLSALSIAYTTVRSDERHTSAIQRMGLTHPKERAAHTGHTHSADCGDKEGVSRSGAA